MAAPRIGLDAFSSRRVSERNSTRRMDALYLPRSDTNILTVYCIVEEANVAQCFPPGYERAPTFSER